nr:unnamed protein product [Digitaria exilis]
MFQEWTAREVAQPAVYVNTNEVQPHQVLGDERRTFQTKSIRPKVLKPEYPDSACNNMPEPAVQEELVVVVVEITEPEVTRFERRTSTEAQKILHKLPALLHSLRLPNVVGDACDAQARSALPEVTPAPSDHARPHGLRGRHEAEDVLEDAIRQRIDAAARHGDALAPSIHGHSVEHGREAIAIPSRLERCNHEGMKQVEAKEGSLAVLSGAKTLNADDASIAGGYAHAACVYAKVNKMTCVERATYVTRDHPILTMNPAGALGRTAPPPPPPPAVQHITVGPTMAAGRTTRPHGPTSQGLFGGYGSLSPTQPTTQFPPDPTAAPHAGGSYKWAGARPSTACAAAGSDLRRRDHSPATYHLLIPLLRRIGSDPPYHPEPPPPPPPPPAAGERPPPSPSLAVDLSSSALGWPSPALSSSLSLSLAVGFCFVNQRQRCAGFWIRCRRMVRLAASPAGR